MSLVEAVLERLFPPAAEPIELVRGRSGAHVVVRGRVVARDAMQSPLTGERCVYYRYLLEGWRMGVAWMGGGGVWLALEADEAICEFYIEDETGRALILPEGAVVDTVRGLGAERVAMPSGQRATETRIAEGDVVEVRGVAGEIADVLDDARGYREDPVRALVRAGEGERLRIRLVGRG